jgi:hypothetical protein
MCIRVDGGSDMAVRETKRSHGRKESPMKREKVPFIFLGSLLLLCFVGTCAEAESFDLRKVADLNTPIPGGSGNFLGFGYGECCYPAISGSNVAFMGGEDDNGKYGIYLFNGTTIVRVADSNTPIPGTSENFTGFSGFVISGGNVAFFGWDRMGIYFFNGSTLVKVAEGTHLQQIPPVISGNNVAFTPWAGYAVYLFNGSTLRQLVNIGTPIPGGLGYFTGFDDPVISGNNVAFHASGESGKEGIYLHDGTNLSKVVDLNTPIPEGSGNFAGFYPPLISGNNVAFHGFGESEEGIYLYNGISLSKVVDLNTPIPEGSGNFSFIWGLHGISGGNVVFQAFGQSEQGGIYLYDGTSLSKVVDRNTPIPGGSGNFIFAYHVGMDGRNVVFDIGEGYGIYLFDGTTISKVVDLYTQIPEGSGTFRILYRPEISGNNVVFVGGGSDQVGIYLASIQPQHIYVGQDGFCGSKSLCLKSIQSGIDSAQALTIIDITQETYVEDVIFDDLKVVTLRGGWDTEFMSRPFNTTIKGSLTISNGTMTLENIVLK